MKNLKVWEWDRITIPAYGKKGTPFANGLYVDVNYDTLGVSISGGQMRFYVDPLNPDPVEGSTFSHRSEIRTAPWRINHPLGTEQWVGWRYTFGDDYVIDSYQPVTIWQQHHGTPGSPPIQLEIASLNRPRPALGGEIQVVNAAFKPEKQRIVYPVTPRAGETLDIVIHVIHGLGNQGLLQVWLNGVLYHDYVGQTVWDHSPWGGNNKWGLYPHGWKTTNFAHVQQSIDAGADHHELFMGTLKLLTRSPSDPGYRQDAFHLVSPQ